jgi:hypothetical protein
VIVFECRRGFGLGEGMRPPPSRVGRGREVTAAGPEERGRRPSQRAPSLKDAKIEGALLTETKLYGDASTEKFEGVFIEQTEFKSPADKGVTSYGIPALGPLAKNGEGRADRKILLVCSAVPPQRTGRSWPTARCDRASAIHN